VKIAIITRKRNMIPEKQNIYPEMKGNPIGLHGLLQG
jgi:hypothetical protein